MDKKINLRTIAEHFDVSATTVSLALRNDKSISDDLKSKIVKYAKMHNYKTPSLKKLDAGFVGILQPIDDSTIKSWGLFTEIIESIKTELLKMNYNVIIIPVFKTSTYENILNCLIALPVEALISIHYVSRNLFEAIESLSIPIVVINNALIKDNPDILENKFFSILVDDIQAGYDACNRLIKNEHKSVLYIDYKRDDLPHVMIDRKLGVEKAVLLHEKKLVLFHERLKIVSLENISRILDKHYSKISAIIVHDDYIGRLVFNVLDKNKNISLISMGGIYSDIPPRFSSYQIDGSKMGKIAVEEIQKELLQNNTLDKYKNKEIDRRIYKISQVYIDRGSITRLQE